MSDGLRRAKAAAWATRNAGDGIPSPSLISALLTHTGFARADRNNSESAGFVIGAFPRIGDTVTVRHQFPGTGEPDADLITDVMLGEYATVIEAAGYKVERDNIVGRLIVTPREDPRPVLADIRDSGVTEADS